MNALAGSVATADGFESAFRLLLPALRGYARRLTGEPTQSEDLVQETLMRAWAARHRFIPGSNLKAWLFRIEFNCFISSLRKSRRVVQLSPEMADVRLTTPATQEEGLMMRDLARALAALPQDQADALALINDEQISYEDAANRLRIPIGTMKSRTTRARSAVKTFLSGDPAQREGPAAPKSKETHGRLAAQVDQPATRNSLFSAWKASGQRMIG